MSAGDFLRKDAQTPLSEHFLMAGVRGAISTNFPDILDAARESFCPVEGPDAEPGLRLRFWVDPKGTTQPPWPKPFFRGLGHLVFAGFDSQSSMLIDLQSRRVLGRFSPAMGADRAYWKAVILPVLVSIMGPTVGITELHCGCVATEGSGLFLAGRSGSGKSTLALALAQLGFGYVSDDRTFCTKCDGRLTAWGLPTLLKLRPESARMFQEFQGLDPAIAPNGERAFLIDPDRSSTFQRVPRCDPHWLVVLERQEARGFDLAPMSPVEASSRLEEGLIAADNESVELQRKTIADLAARACWRLTYGGRPQEVAEELARHFGRSRQRPHLPVPPGAIAGTNQVEVNAVRPDPLRRFALTPCVADLPLMGRSVHLETNSPAILQRMRGLFGRYSGTPGRRSDFLWRIMIEPQAGVKPPWPEISAFSQEGLRFINIGQRSFIAVDLKAREAAAVLAEGLAEDPLGFSSPFLDDLFCLTASMLGLVPLTAACIASGDHGILVLGPPNCGKTTSSYLAWKSGLEFLADQAVFLEIVSGQLRAWGDFLPAVFRPETVQFLPELRQAARSFQYRDLAFLYLEKDSDQTVARPVTPVCCVFLERHPSMVPYLAPLRRDELSQRFVESLPFKDDRQFGLQRAEVIEALEKLPSYRLIHGCDPAAVTRIYRSLLLDHGLSTES